MSFEVILVSVAVWLVTACTVASWNSRTTTTKSNMIMTNAKFVNRSKITFTLVLAGNMNSFSSIIWKRSSKLPASRGKMSSKLLWLYLWFQYIFMYLKLTFLLFFSIITLFQSPTQNLMCKQHSWIGSNAFLLQFLHPSPQHWCLVTIVLDRMYLLLAIHSCT